MTTHGTTALDVAVRSPTTHPADATVGDVRTFLAGEHVHLALLVDDAGHLVAAVQRDDLHGLDDAAPASEAADLAGRTVRADLPEPDLAAAFVGGASRRLAVVDDTGRLLGLVCRKRSGHGYCSDAGIRSRRDERAASR
ncbi:CBS domain-containing protein [Nocardioides acrostichi]|uniref:CBS domain-containing protein n=1 Tax=Nocardioides acrostichi TaxID=2784339 RepID=A0A930UZD9_9ACTN|nr:CBS domain-containing protein [Nocardioides acrostichi]MBF4160845.1 CBS domain-containing protein [Nocardioides acrostichi]